MLTKYGLSIGHRTQCSYIRMRKNKKNDFDQLGQTVRQIWDLPENNFKLELVGLYYFDVYLFSLAYMTSCIRSNLINI